MRNQTKEVAFTPAEYAQLTVQDPDLWWPYQWGDAKLYHLKLDFKADDKSETSDSQAIDFGIRKITQARDSDNSFPDIGTGGNFYLKINGRDYLIRGGVYSPDLLFRNDPERDANIMRYAKDLGLNLLRWELKIADDTMIERADHEGMPVMLGFMCCAQWEHWDLWNAEDQWVARASLRARIRELRSHPSVVIWANGSDGLPPDPVLNDYHQILQEEHWQNAVVDTVSHVNRTWSGIHMAGPYVWRPPYYWFSDQYGPARGSSAEEGDNETIPPLESLKKFIPADKLWPINEYWYFHSGANEGNSTLENVQRVIDKRYGPSSSAEEFSRKAQLAHYEDVRAQYETYASHWTDRKMMIHWMMNNPWPSFFGHLFDDYFKPGGGYFGAKKGLRPVNVVWDYYATGDRSKARVYVVNQTSEARSHLKVAVEFFNLEGKRQYFTEISGFSIAPNTSDEAMTVPRVPNLALHSSGARRADDGVRSSVGGERVLGIHHRRRSGQRQKRRTVQDQPVPVGRPVSSEHHAPQRPGRIGPNLRRQRPKTGDHNPGESRQPGGILCARGSHSGSRRERDSADYLRRQLHHGLPARDPDDRCAFRWRQVGPAQPCASLANRGLQRQQEDYFPEVTTELVTKESGRGRE